jgi:hypothetical protein
LNYGATNTNRNYSSDSDLSGLEDIYGDEPPPRRNDRNKREDKKEQFENAAVSYLD